MVKKFSDLTNRIGSNAPVQQEKVQGPPEKATATTTTTTTTTGEAGGVRIDSLFFTIAHVEHFSTSLKLRSQSEETANFVSASNSFSVTQT